MQSPHKAMDAHASLLRASGGLSSRALTVRRASSSRLSLYAVLGQAKLAKCDSARRRWGCAWLAPRQRGSGGARRRSVCPHASLQSQLLGVGLFFTPGMLALAYAFVKGRGNLRDGLSRLLTEVRAISSSSDVLIYVDN